MVKIFSKICVVTFINIIDQAVLFSFMIALLLMTKRGKGNPSIIIPFQVSCCYYYI